MAENFSDANTGTETAEDTGSSPDVELQPIVDSEGLISTAEYQPITQAEEADSADDTPDDAGQNTSSQPSQNQDFHNHPRFKELVEEKNRYKQAADEYQRRLSAIESQMAANSEPKEGEPVVNIFEGKDNDELIDMFTESPQEFISSLTQTIIQNIDTRTAEQRRAQAQAMYQQRQDQTFKDFFAGKEAEVTEMYPQIKAFVESHPGHNAISAYQALTEEKRIQAAVEKEKKKFINELKAKGNARSFSSIPGSTRTAPSKSPEMTNPDKFGGRIGVLAQRMKQRMAAEG